MAAIDCRVAAGSAYQLEFGPDGHLYVSSWAGDAIERYDVSTMTSLGVFADASDGLDGPWGIEFTPDQQVTVTASLNDAPVITSDGGADTANLVVAENTTAVTTVPPTNPTKAVTPNPINSPKVMLVIIVALPIYESWPSRLRQSDWCRDKIFQIFSLDCSQQKCKFIHFSLNYSKFL